MRLSFEADSSPRSYCPLPQFFFDEIKHEVDEFIEGFGEFFFDGGEVISFGFAVVAAVLTAGAAPTTGVEWIDDGGRADEVKGIDDALVIERTLPKLMQAVLAFQNWHRLIHIHHRTLLATEIALGGFVIELID